MGDLYAGTATLRFPCLSSLRVFSASDGVGSWRRGEKKKHKSRRSTRDFSSDLILGTEADRQTDTHTHSHTYTHIHVRTRTHNFTPTRPPTHAHTSVRACAPAKNCLDFLLRRPTSLYRKVQYVFTLGLTCTQYMSVSVMHRTVTRTIGNACVYTCICFDLFCKTEWLPFLMEGGGGFEPLSFSREDP